MNQAYQKSVGKRPGVGEESIEMICDALGLDKTEGVLRLFLTNNQKIRKFFTKIERL